MQTQLSESGDVQNTVIHIREQETENYNALVQEIWRRFANEPIEMRRSRIGSQLNATTNPETLYARAHKDLYRDRRKGKEEYDGTKQRDKQ